MLQSEDISKINEIKGLYSERWIQPEFMKEHINRLKVSSKSKLFTSIKTSGVGFWTLFNVLLLFPFMDVKNVKSYISGRFAIKSITTKDVLYRILKKQNINWRSILLMFVKRYIELEKQSLDVEPETGKYLIFDDTDIEKTGKKIEGVSKIFNHVSKRYILGFKLLVAGYWDGNIFVPVDFSFHRENKKNKYGLKRKEIEKQYSVKRDSKHPVHKRFRELNSSKTNIVVEMYRRINSRKIHVDYILFDSWFTSIKLIKKLKSINEEVNIIGMFKYIKSKVVIGGKTYSLKQLRNIGKLQRSRKHKYYYREFIVVIDGVKVKLFFTKKGKNGNWHTLLSTDTNLTFTKALTIYSKRWTIEVFFKEVKQLLGLGKTQSTNFDVQIAQTTIIMIQYLLIAIKYRMEAYGTIGGLFKGIKQDYFEYRLSDRILALMNHILHVLDFFLDKKQSDEIISALITYSNELNFLEEPN